MAEFKAYVQYNAAAGMQEVVLENGRETVKILPDAGSNLYSYVVDGVERLGPVENFHEYRAYGTPVLFPLPNRVRDCTFTFHEAQYPQAKHGEPRFLHSMVYDEPFEFAQPTSDFNEATVTTWVDFEPGKEIYKSFPWACRLTLSFSLTAEGLDLSYTVENRDAKPLPFGIAIHSFFLRTLPNDQIELRVQCPRKFLADKELLPTGELMDVKGTYYDLTEFRKLSELVLDDVFDGMDNQHTAEARFADGSHLVLQASDDCKKVVVYAPEGGNIFCMENQTCSTDAHNFYNKGLEKLSSLLVLEPKTSHSGCFTYRWL